MAQVMVHQVRTTDPFGNVRIIHAYETEDQAKQAISMMSQKTGHRYTYVNVPNRPEEHWGINFPGTKPIGPLIARIAQPVELHPVEPVDEPVVDAPQEVIGHFISPKKKTVRRKK